MAQAMLPGVSVNKEDHKALTFLLKQKLETCPILIDRAITALKSEDYQRASFLAFMSTVIATNHFKKRTRDASQVLLVSSGVIRAAVAHAEVPPALEYLAGILAARCHGQGEENFPCLGTSPEAQKWISKKIRILVHEGYPIRQSAAIAYSMARKRGYRIPQTVGCDEDWR